MTDITTTFKKNLISVHELDLATFYVKGKSKSREIGTLLAAN